jgi:hypothetical protein
VQQAIAVTLDEARGEDVVAEPASCPARSRQDTTWLSVTTHEHSPERWWMRPPGTSISRTPGGVATAASTSPDNADARQRGGAPNVVREKQLRFPSDARNVVDARSYSPTRRACSAGAATNSPSAGTPACAGRQQCQGQRSRRRREDERIACEEGDDGAHDDGGHVRRNRIDAEHAGQEAQALSNAVLRDVARFRDTRPPSDDMTLLVLRRRG